MLSALMLLAGNASQPVPLDPTTWFSTNDYPIEAVVEGAEGAVEYEVDVNSLGRPTACAVKVSSGNAYLDKATCDLIMKNGRFQPAQGADGRPVAGKYNSKIRWEQPTSRPSSFEAAILDFSNDASKPECTILSKDRSTNYSLCANLLNNGSYIGQLAERYKRVTFLVASSPADMIPFRGSSEWGARLSFLASEQFYQKGSFPIACVTVAAEGWEEGRDACAGFPNNRVLSDEEKSSAKAQKVEISVFGINR